MGHLVAIGVMSRSGEHYALTEIGESMREGRTGNRGPLTLDINSAVGRANLASVKLLESVRTGGPAYPLIYGCGFWEDLAANPELRAGFGGKVLVVEAVLGSRDDMAGMTAFDLFMLVCCGGRERTLEEFTALGRGAGLDLRRVVGGTWTSVLEFIAGEGG